MIHPGRTSFFCRFSTAFLFAFVGPAAAQVTPEEAACRSKLSKSYAKVVQSAHKAVAKCHRSRLKGSLAESTNCNDVATADSSTGSKTAGALAKLTDVALTSCVATPGVLGEFLRCPAPAQAVDDGDATSGIDNYTELTSCMAEHIELVIGKASDAALGLPGLSVSTGAQKCHGTIAKAQGKLIDTTIKERSKCQVARDKAGELLEFACATADPNTKIATTVAKALSSIEEGCAAGASELDSCSTTGAGVADCVIDEVVIPAASGLASLAWELPGTCPGAVSLHIDSDVANDTDRGWTGYGHDEMPVGGYFAATYELACDADCANCTGTPNVPDDHCRCSGDSSVECSVDGDCSGFGGDCRCYLSPPNHVANYSSACQVIELPGPLAGDAEPSTGEASLSFTGRLFHYLGDSFLVPCPVCEAGTCVGGRRNGLACTVGGTDATFGDTSLDCLPDPLDNISGDGAVWKLNLGTGSVSLPAALPCDPPLGFFDCTCSSCTGDSSRGCNSNSECSSVGAGSCRTDGLHGGASRMPNRCSDLVCSADPDSPATEGVCASDPDDRYCDGVVRENGRGILPCSSNTDCSAFDGQCPDGDCGNCTLTEKPNCFRDPIAASGASGSVLVGLTCAPATGSGAYNASLGLPGPTRIQQRYALAGALCPDDTTPYVAPGGSTCP